jgi:hypothetical protein
MHKTRDWLGYLTRMHLRHHLIAYEVLMFRLGAHRRLWTLEWWSRSDRRTT